jgi:Helicase HerA, central domain
MEIHPGIALVRRRLAAAVPGFVLFSAMGFAGLSSDSNQAWFFIGLGLALSATFIEPYYRGPRTAIVNSGAAFASYAGINTGSVEALWIAMLVFLLLVLIAGVTASVSPEGPVNIASKQFSTRLGGAAVLGGLLLGLIVVTDAQMRIDGFEWLAFGSAILVISVTFDWAGLWTRLGRRQETATALAAIGPRILLVSSSPSQAFTPGDDVTVAAGAHEIPGSVIARLPHAQGLRYRIALTQEWTNVCRSFPQSIALSERAGSDLQVAGAVSEGTTQDAIRFEPIRRLHVGDPLLISSPAGDLLYQVAHLSLTSSTWAGSKSVIPEAVAHLVGHPEGTFVRSVTYLPEPHDTVYAARGFEGSLGDDYYELGTVKGTRVPIGIRTDDERRGHIAILGMSGMGKTAVAQRICKTFGADHTVVALDATGEYASRLDFPEWENDLNAPGHFVFQPRGEPPKEASNFIEGCMTAGDQEYRENKTPRRRVIMLEEAHAFLPEWNFALQKNETNVAYSTRMIMQARKFGLTFMIVSQRTAVVSKSALSQCENYIILKTLDQTGLEYLESLVGREMRHAIPNLERYEAMCVGPAFNAEAPVIVSLAPP